jgi:hypothetical protein
MHLSINAQLVLAGLQEILALAESAPGGGGGAPFDRTALFGWWDFENDELDQSGNGNNFASGDPHYNAGGKVGVAAAFDNAIWNANRSQPSNASLETGDVDWTWCGWCYPTDLSNFNPLGGKRHTTFEWQTRINTGGDSISATVFKTDASDSIVATLTTPFLANTWYFVRFWYTASDKKVRIDVNESGTPAVSAAASFTPMAAPDADFVVGKFGQAGNEFTGRIDSVGWFKRLLTSDEGLYLYNGGAGRSYATL